MSIELSEIKSNNEFLYQAVKRTLVRHVNSCQRHHSVQKSCNPQ